MLFTGPDWGATPLLGHTRGKVAVFNENIRTIAARHDGVIADLWALRQLADPRMWDPDRLHFSPLGHHTIAAMVLETLGVPHSLRAAETQAYASRQLAGRPGGDLAWATHYLVPWMVNRIRTRAGDAPLAAKRPEPGPVSGSRSAAPDPAAGAARP